jgi:hypothetical protein
LPGFETALGLVDDENPALAPHYTIIAVAPPQRFQGVTNFHRTSLNYLRRHRGARRFSARTIGGHSGGVNGVAAEFESFGA